MFCKNCGKLINKEEYFCSNCGLKIDNHNIVLSRERKNNFNIIWIMVTILLAVATFGILMAGVMIGIGSGYNNPDSQFSFEPYAYAFLVTFFINILFNIVMIIIRATKK